MVKKVKRTPKMSKLFSRLANLLSSRTFVGADKAGNKYFTRNEQMDGILKEKRWIVFKGEEDPTTVPVEWICWLNGQRKKAPTPEEMAELEAKRERIKLNVALLKKEEEERKAQEGNTRQKTSTAKHLTSWAESKLQDICSTVCFGKVGGPDLKSFIQQYPTSSLEGNKNKDGASAVEAANEKYRTSEEDNQTSDIVKQQPESSEPTGSGQSFKPGTWQPPV